MGLGGAVGGGTNFSTLGIPSLIGPSLDYPTLGYPSLDASGIADPSSAYLGGSSAPLDPGSGNVEQGSFYFINYY
jgi:hypothetical protein